MAKSNGLTDILISDIEKLIMNDELTIRQIIKQVLPESLWQETLNVIEKITNDPLVDEQVSQISFNAATEFIKGLNEKKEMKYYYSDILDI